MHGAHACLVPVNYHTANVFKQLAEKKKAARHTRACDYYHHLLLLLPFILSNLFRDEVEEHNRHHRGAPSPVIDPSEALIGVTNVFLRWYMLFRMTTQGKTAADIGTLRALSLADTDHSMYYNNCVCCTSYIHYTYYIFHHRLFDLFKSVFSLQNKVGCLIMDTEKVHSIKHCHIDVTNFANPINCCCDGPEGGHKTWVHQQGCCVMP